MRQLLSAYDEDDFAWLKSLADADNVGVGEIVRRCVRWARESQDEPAQEPQLSPQQIARREFEAQRADFIREQQRELEELIARKRENLEILMRPPILGPSPGADVGNGPPAGNRIRSVLDLDLSNEPRAEEIDVPADPDDLPRVPLVASGQRPGAATRPAPPNPNLAIGNRMGDAGGNVVRSNYPHLGFARGN